MQKRDFHGETTAWAGEELDSTLDRGLNGDQNEMLSAGISGRVAEIWASVV